MSYNYYLANMNLFSYGYNPLQQNFYHNNWIAAEQIQNPFYYNFQQPFYLTNVIDSNKLNERKTNAQIQVIIVNPEAKIEIKPKEKRRRGVDKQKELESAKKNSESNLINQFFSYFSSRSQSEEIVVKAISASVGKIEQIQKVISIFYNLMKCMSLQRAKKYVNRKILQNIFEKKHIEKQIPDMLLKFQSIGFVTIEEICQTIRRCCLHFLREISLISILSSKRISFLSKKEHLKKRRNLINVLMGRE